MKLAQWRQERRQGEPFTLPSGLVMHLKRVGILDLVEQGEIPAPLAGLVQEIVDQKEHDLQLEDFGRFSGLINLLTKAAAVDPPVADEADETHLGVGELPMADRMAIFNWCNEVTEALRPFRAESAQPV